MKTIYRIEKEEITKPESYPWLSFMKIRLRQNKWVFVLAFFIVFNIVAGLFTKHYYSDGMIPFAYTVGIFATYLCYCMMVNLGIYLTSNPEISWLSNEYNVRAERLAKKFKAVKL